MPQRTYYDIHCHIYPDFIAPKAAAGIDSFYKGLPGDHSDGTVGTLFEHRKRAGITLSVVHSVATAPRQVHNINTFIANTVSAHQKELIGFGTLHPFSAELKKDIDELHALGLRGVKMHPDIQGFDADCEGAMAIYEACARVGLPVLLHTGDYRYDRSNPDRIINILRTFPGLKLIAAHFGGYTVWEEAAEKLPGRFEDLYVDSSSTTLYIPPEKVAGLVRAYGAERVMFGTDYPMCVPEQEAERFEALELSEEEKERVARGTFEAFFAHRA